MKENPLSRLFSAVRGGPRPADLTPLNRAETPAQRTDLIIRAWQDAVKQKRLNPSELGGFANTQSFEDAMQVYLGLKPSCGFLTSSIDRDNPTFHGLGYRMENVTRLIPGKDVLGVTTLVKRETNQWGGIDLEGVWNPDAVDQILADNPDLVKGRTVDTRNADQYEDFEYQIGKGRKPADIALHGLLYGYPKEQAVVYGRMIGRLFELEDRLEQYTQKRGMTLFEGYSNIHGNNVSQLIDNRNGLKQKVLTTIKQAHMNVTPDILRYIELSRRADIPGFPYATVGDSTRELEQQQRENWENSGMPTKVNKLLTRYGLAKI